MRAYMLRRLGRAALTAILLALVVAVLVTSMSHHGEGPATWLVRAARLDFGRTSDDGPVIVAIGAAFPATALLLLAATMIGVGGGWGGGALLALVHGSSTLGRGGAEGTGKPHFKFRLSVSPWLASLRGLALVADVCQGLPAFWLGGVLVALCGMALGILPPGGIAGPALPAFGSAAYMGLLAAQPALVLGDLLSHLVLPALTLALAGLATGLRLVSTSLPREFGAPHTRVARAAGLSKRRLLWRAARPTLPLVVAGSSAGLPLLASALILVEYLFGWPGLGLLAYHAARSGDVATLGALLLLFGLAVIALSAVTDIIAAWADPRRRGPFP